MITFLRMRPADVIDVVSAATRRKAGTTALEVDQLDDAARRGALEGGVLPVARTVGAVEPAAWVVHPSASIQLADSGIPGWRITVVHDQDRAATLDGLARSRAAFLRTGRSRVAEAGALVSLPAIAARVSVFADSVDEAVAAVEAGAGDLLLRGWNTALIGELRAALAGSLVERTAFPVGVGVDDLRAGLDADLFAATLALLDGTGAARPRYEWAPGKDLDVPAPARRMSALWPDASWTGGAAPSGLAAVRGERRAVLERALEGVAPTRDEIVDLFHTRGDEVEAVAWTADRIRAARCGDTVTYVVNRNINYTNQCTFRCGFCAFSKGPRSLNLRGEPYLMSIAQVVERSVEAWERGATEVCLQGGIHPEFTGDFYVDLVEAIKHHLPDLHIHGFTPLEVWQGAETLGTDVRSFLVRLRDAGLGTLPGTAAEILDDRVREHLCPDKIRTAQWAEVMITAHEIGLRSTSTVMFGHIDGPDSWANHIEVLREIQRRTGGITEFVPLPFVHMGAPIYVRGRSRPGPTWDEVVLVHAVARIAFAGLIDNIQASWVKLGLGGAARLLRAGCNDLGGTLMDEIISRSAGAAHGTSLEASDLADAIRSAGRVPQPRTTLYAPIAAPLPQPGVSAPG